MGRSKTKPKLICSVCGKEFERYEYDIKRGGGLYCSNICHALVKTLPKPSKEELINSYNNPPKSTNDLARLYGVSKGTIYNWFKKYSIECRSISKATSIALMGHGCSEETRKKMSETAIKNGKWQGKNHPNFTSPWKHRSRGVSGKRVDLDNKFFRSRYEANFARVLNYRKSQGEIIDWDYEKETYEFIPIKKGNRFYTPDFRIFYPDGTIERIELKGYMDDASKTKLNRMAKYYPEIEITLITTKEYKELSKQYRPIIGELWEKGSGGF